MKINLNKSFRSSLLFKYSNFILILISGFLLIPFYLKNFSLELYGTWIIISAITSGLILIDPGSTNLIIQQIAKAIGKKNKQNLSGIILSAIINSLIVASLILLIGIIFGEFLLLWFVDSLSFAGEIKIVLKYAIFAITITLLGQTLYGILEGFQKTFISGLFILSCSLIKIISVVLLIKLNYGIKSLPLSDLIAGTFLFTFCLIYLGINYKFFFIELKLKLYEYKKFTSLYLYGYVGRLTKILTNGNIDHLIIGKLIGLENVSIYYLAQSLPKKIESFIGVLFISARSSLAYLSANASTKNFLKLKLKLIYAVLLLFIFVIFFLYDTLDPFLKLWLNKDISPGFYILFLIIILSSQRLLTNAFSIILFSEGKIKEISKFQMIYSLILIPFLIIGIKFYGLSGLLIAHIVILLITLTLLLSIMILKDMLCIKIYKRILLKEIIFLILTAIVSFLIHKITLQFYNIQIFNWETFVIILLTKVFLFIFILSLISKNFRDEFIYLLRKKKFYPLKK